MWRSEYTSACLSLFRSEGKAVTPPRSARATSQTTPLTTSAAPRGLPGSTDGPTEEELQAIITGHNNDMSSATSTGQRENFSDWGCYLLTARVCALALGLGIRGATSNRLRRIAAVSAPLPSNVSVGFVEDRAVFRWGEFSLHFKKFVAPTNTDFWMCTKHRPRKMFGGMT